LNDVPVIQKKSNKKVILIVILSVVLVFLIIAFIVWRVIDMGLGHIKDTNGGDTAVATFNMKDYYNKNIGGTSFMSSTVDINDSLKFTFGKFSGMSELKKIKSSGSGSFKITSNIEEGNFEVAIYKDKTCVKVYNANESVEYKLEGTGDYYVVVGGESAKGNITVDLK
jgi:hypothetical protein